jgi:uncharacterized protein (DUF2141 family)
LKTYNFRSILLFIALFALGTLSLQAQISLQITISELDSNEGNVLLELLDKNGDYLQGFTEPIVNNECTITLDNLKCGWYSFKYFHDRNMNKTLDTYWFAAPKEGFGFSNNARGRFGPPKLEHTLFEVKQDTSMVCTPRYYYF